MLIEIIKAAVAVTAIIVYAVTALNETLAERRENKRAERTQVRIQLKRCRDMYRNWITGGFAVEPEEEDKHLNIICEDPTIAPAFK